LCTAQRNFEIYTQKRGIQSFRGLNLPSRGQTILVDFAPQKPEFLPTEYLKLFRILWFEKYIIKLSFSKTLPKLFSALKYSKNTRKVQKMALKLVYFCVFLAILVIFDCV